MTDQTASTLAAALLISVGALASAPATAVTVAAPVRTAPANTAPANTGASSPSTATSTRQGARPENRGGDGSDRGNGRQSRLSDGHGGRDRYERGYDRGYERGYDHGRHDGYRGRDPYHGYGGRFGSPYGGPHDFRGAWGYMPGFHGFQSPYGFGWGWGGGFSPAYFPARPVYNGWGWGWGGGFAPAYPAGPHWGGRGGDHGYGGWDHHSGHGWGDGGMRGDGRRPRPSSGWGRMDDTPRDRGNR